MQRLNVDGLNVTKTFGFDSDLGGGWLTCSHRPLSIVKNWLFPSQSLQLQISPVSPCIWQPKVQKSWNNPVYPSPDQPLKSATLRHRLIFCWMFAAASVLASTNQQILCCSQTAAAAAVHYVLFLTLSLPLLKGFFYIFYIYAAKNVGLEGTPGHDSLENRVMFS